PEAGRPVIAATAYLGVEAAHVEVGTLFFVAPPFRLLEKRDVLDEVLDALTYHIRAKPDIGVRDYEDRTGPLHLDELIGARAVAAPHLADTAFGAGGLRNPDPLDRERIATRIRLPHRREWLQQDECNTPQQEPHVPCHCHLHLRRRSDVGKSLEFVLIGTAAA